MSRERVGIRQKDRFSDSLPSTRPVEKKPKRRELLKNGAEKCSYDAFKEISKRPENEENRGFGQYFPSGWSLTAYKIRLTFCPPFPLPTDTPPQFVRTKPLPPRQDESGSRKSVSSCNPVMPRESRILSRPPPHSRPRDSRAHAFDKCSFFRQLPIQHTRRIPIRSKKTVSPPSGTLSPPQK